MTHSVWDPLDEDCGDEIEPCPQCGTANPGWDDGPSGATAKCRQCRRCGAVQEDPEDPTRIEIYIAAKKEQAILRLNFLLPCLELEQIEALFRIVAACPSKEFSEALEFLDRAIKNGQREQLKSLAQDGITAANPPQSPVRS